MKSFHRISLQTSRAYCINFLISRCICTNVHNRYVPGVCINLEIPKYLFNLETSLICFHLLLRSHACIHSWHSHIIFKRHMFPQYILTAQVNTANFVSSFLHRMKYTSWNSFSTCFFLLDGCPTAYDRPHLKSPKMFTFWMRNPYLLGPVTGTNR